MFLLQKFVDDDTSSKRQNKALQYDIDEDESMKSDSEENIDEDSDEAANKQEGYGSRKEKAGKKLSEVKESSGKKKSNTGSGHKSGPPNKIIKNLEKSINQDSRGKRKPQ
jgi:protein DEK